MQSHVTWNEDDAAWPISKFYLKTKHLSEDMRLIRENTNDLTQQVLQQANGEVFPFIQKQGSMETP
jgi:hypothetical protein